MPHEDREWMPGVAWVVLPLLLLAVLELFHPHPGDDPLQLDTRAWLTVHYLQIPLFALSALSLGSLVRHRGDIAAHAARAFLFVFAISFIAFDTTAGVSVGILVQAAQQSPHPQAWLAPIDALWTHPIMGGSGVDDSASLAVIGRWSLWIGTVATAVSLRRAGAGWLPLLLLVGAGYGLNFFHAHSWPGGPLTFGGLAVAAGWLRWEQQRRRGTGTVTSTRGTRAAPARAEPASVEEPPLAAGQEARSAHRSVRATSR